MCLVQLHHKGWVCVHLRLKNSYSMPRVTSLNRNTRLMCLIFFFLFSWVRFERWFCIYLRPVHWINFILRPLTNSISGCVVMPSFPCLILFLVSLSILLYIAPFTLILSCFHWSRTKMKVLQYRRVLV